MVPSAALPGIEPRSSSITTLTELSISRAGSTMEKFLGVSALSTPEGCHASGIDSFNCKNKKTCFTDHSHSTMPMWAA